MRTMIAFYVAPLAVPLLLLVLPGRIPPDAVVAGSVIVAYAGTFLFGVPAYLYFRARNWTEF
jgi:uncharacterized membrane protein YfcA